jgi:hypothetical protein
MECWMIANVARLDSSEGLIQEINGVHVGKWQNFPAIARIEHCLGIDLKTQQQWLSVLIDPKRIRLDDDVIFLTVQPKPRPLLNGLSDVASHGWLFLGYLVGNEFLLTNSQQQSHIYVRNTGIGQSMPMVCLAKLRMWH